jgi:FkbM family methyltransferase
LARTGRIFHTAKNALARKSGGLITGFRVFDIGTQQGVVAMILANITSDTGRVIALEASKHNADVASRNVNANNMEDQINVMHAAGGAQDGQACFDNGFNGQVMREGKTIASGIIPMHSIDSLATEYGRPDVAMVDVDGFEGEVLR